MVVDLEGRGREGGGAFSVLEGHLKLLFGADDAAELVDEVHVPRRPAELAVGGTLKAQLLLQSDDVANGLVFDLPEAVGVEFAFSEVLPRLEQFGWAEETADEVGSKWWG